MTMRTYYFELDNVIGGPYKLQAESDAKAIEGVDTKNLLILYRESDTKDGTPFVTLWERGDKNL